MGDKSYIRDVVLVNCSSLININIVSPAIMIQWLFIFAFGWKMCLTFLAVNQCFAEAIFEVTVSGG